MGYRISSLLAIGPDDQHTHFIYYLPTNRVRYEWVNAWMARHFDDLAGKLGPTINTEDATFNPVWLVPSTTMADRMKPNNQNKLRFVASMKAGTKDQDRAFRHVRSELPGRILAILDSLADP